MANLAGFKRIYGVPPKQRSSKYDQLIQTVEDTGHVYYLDLKSRNKARSVTTTIRNRAPKIGVYNIKVYLRGTAVYVRRDDND